MLRSVLLALPRSPFDPGSELAAWLRHAGERLAEAGHEVRCLGVSATGADPSGERGGGGPTDAAWLQRHAGVDRVAYRVEREGASQRAVVGLLDFERAGVLYRLIDTGDRGADPSPSSRADAASGRVWDREGSPLVEMFDAMLHRGIADAGPGGVVLTFGESAAWRARRALARDAGQRVVVVLGSDEAPTAAVGEADAVVSVDSGVEKRAGGWSAWAQAL